MMVIRLPMRIFLLSQVVEIRDKYNQYYLKNKKSMIIQLVYLSIEEEAEAEDEKAEDEEAEDEEDEDAL